MNGDDTPEVPTLINDIEINISPLKKTADTLPTIASRFI